MRRCPSPLNDGPAQRLFVEENKMIFDAVSYDDHEQVAFCRDSASGLRALIAIHRPGPKGRALGGCRMVNYASEEEALDDVLRLSKGMTYKAAVAGLALGGAKGVIIGDPLNDKTPELMRAMARAVEGLGGRYITSVDVGISGADVAEMQKITKYAVGANAGDPSPMTSLGVFVGLKAAAEHEGITDLKGVRVGILGVGKVGYGLAEYLHGEGAELVVSDTNKSAVEKAVAQLGATEAPVETFLSEDMDIFAPCALGGIIDDASLKLMKAKIIAGGANNQLRRDGLADDLKSSGILYAPDYVINAGGLIMVDSEVDLYSLDEVRDRTMKIAGSLAEIFKASDEKGITTLAAAEEMAKRRYSESWATAAE